MQTCVVITACVAFALGLTVGLYIMVLPTAKPILESYGINTHEIVKPSKSNVTSLHSNTFDITALDNISACPVYLLPATCLNPAWLGNAPVIAPWNLTIMHAKVLNTGSRSYNTGCPNGCGHGAVGPSILRGMTNLGVGFHFQPTHDDQIKDIVYVHRSDAHDGALSQALKWRDEGKVKLVIGGPNIVVSCKEAPIFEKLDAVIVPSVWVAIFYVEECPYLQSKIRVLANGVDENYWKPSGNSNRTSIAMYLKSGDSNLHKSLEAAIRAAGHNSIEKIKYGEYNQDSKKTVLDRSLMMVHVTRTESQGIAAAEAWSMDVPTLVWSSYGFQYGSHTAIVSSPSPFLTPATGAFFSTPEELTFMLKNLEPTKRLMMHPREWVLAHMTDTVAARNLLTLIHCEWLRVSRGL